MVNKMGFALPWDIQKTDKQTKFAVYFCIPFSSSET